MIFCQLLLLMLLLLFCCFVIPSKTTRKDPMESLLVLQKETKINVCTNSVKTNLFTQLDKSLLTDTFLYALDAVSFCFCFE